MSMEYNILMEKAKQVSKNAYIPYSHFAVGACVLTKSGKVYTGCNFENASFGLTICAERNAIGSAIADGEKELAAIAIFSPKMHDCTPCGACRQVISEFCPLEGIDIVTENENGLIIRNFNELLPERFYLQ